MKTSHVLLSILVAMTLVGCHQETPQDQLNDAGQNLKQAGKDAGQAMSNETKKATQGIKDEAHEAKEKSEGGG